MRSKWTIAGILGITVLLALIVGLSQAQEPESPGQEVELQGEVGIAAAVEDIIPIQGRLTDNEGNPIDGTFPYTVWFRIYVDDVGGVPLCSISRNGLELNNGLFNTTIPCNHSNIHGQRLYLEMQVGSEVMSPRQPIYPVPYAYSLVPGADVKESVDGASIFEAENSSSANGSKGLLGESTATSGTTYGVYGLVASPNGYGGYFENRGNGPALKAAGSGIIQSTAATDWVVSPLKIVPGDVSGNDDLRVIHSTQFGWVALYTTGTDDVTALLPVDVVAYLFGTRVKFSEFHFCYSMADTALNDYIDQVDVEYVTTSGGHTPLCSFTTNISSTTWMCDTCAAAPPVDIYGPVFVRFKLHFTGDGSDDRIRLGYMYLHLVE